MSSFGRTAGGLRALMADLHDFVASDAALAAGSLGGSGAGNSVYAPSGLSELSRRGPLRANGRLGIRKGTTDHPHYPSLSEALGLRLRVADESVVT